jgi:hypothetical protein
MGGAYVGVATSTVVDLGAVVSIYDIALRPGDCGPNWYHAARGDISRNRITDAFLEGDWTHCLYLDGDMRFPPDLLKRLLAHGKAFVGGLYFRREIDPMWPLAYEYRDPPALPFVPVFDYPERGLMRVNATGSGCWLIRRDVFGAVQAEMQRNIRDGLGLDLDYVPHIVDGPMPEIRGDYQRIGADLRFCYYARRAGVDIWLDCDPELNIGHYAHVPLARADYEAQKARALDSQAGVYGAVAHAYRKDGLVRDSVTLELRRYRKQLEELEGKEEEVRGVITKAQASLRAMQRRRDLLNGAIQALEGLENGGGDAPEA